MEFVGVSGFGFLSEGFYPLFLDVVIARTKLIILIRAGEVLVVYPFLRRCVLD